LCQLTLSWGGNTAGNGATVTGLPLQRTRVAGVDRRGSRFVVVYRSGGRQRKQAAATRASKLARDAEARVERRGPTLHAYALGWLDPGRPGDGRVLLHDGEQLQRKPPDPRDIRVFVAGGVARLVVRRETWADLLARDIEYDST
jgi:hypothetical protein